MSTRSRNPPFQAVFYPPWLGWSLPRTLTPSQAKHLYLHIKTVAFYLDAFTAFVPQTRDSPIQVRKCSNYPDLTDLTNPFSSNPITSTFSGWSRTHHCCLHPSCRARARCHLWVLHHSALSHIRNQFEWCSSNGSWGPSSLINDERPNRGFRRS